MIIWTGLIYFAIFFDGFDEYITPESHIEISNVQDQYLIQKSALRGAAQSAFRSLIISNLESALRLIELDQPEHK